MSRTNGRFDAGPGVGDRLDHRGYHKATIPLACPHEAHGVEEARRTSSTIGGMAYRLLAEGRAAGNCQKERSLRCARRTGRLCVALFGWV